MPRFGERNVYGVDPHNLVMEWHEKYNVPIGLRPNILTPDRLDLRLGLIDEERDELREAVEAEDLIDIADALGDMVYVIYGMAIELGINLSSVMSEIQSSNMSKLGEDGKPIFREDGKVLKGPNYHPPLLKRVLYPNV